MFLVYPQGIWIIVHTANLIYVDWNSKSQGLWMQDFPWKHDGSDKGSGFESDLIDYLSALKGSYAAKKWANVHETLYWAVCQEGDVDLDAAGKTTVLYKLKLGEIVTTIYIVMLLCGVISGERNFDLNVYAVLHSCKISGSCWKYRAGTVVIFQLLIIS
ncbi:putative phosphodiesterase I [Helianthus debilis subsp. tardiflorus]